MRDGLGYGMAATMGFPLDANMQCAVCSVQYAPPYVKKLCLVYAQKVEPSRANAVCVRCVCVHACDHARWHARAIVSRACAPALLFCA